MEDLLLSRKQYNALIDRLNEINKDMNLLKVKPDPETGYINNSDLLTMLQVSAKTAYRWRKSGRLPYIKVENKLYYRAEVILNSFRVHPVCLIEADHSPPLDNDITVDKSFQGCERCPLFMILNS